MYYLRAILLIKYGSFWFNKHTSFLMELFIEYLESKMIDSEAFKQSEPEQWKEWESLYLQVHPKSFTIQKLNLINQIRRKFPLLKD